MCKCQSPELDNETKAKIDEIINKHKHETGCLIPILHEVQEFYGFLPYEAQKLIANGTNIPITDIFGVISFYSRFSTTPTGKNKVSVCMGTACYVKGSDKVLEKVEELLKVKAGETTEDQMFTIEATRCVGACGLAPVIIVNEDVYGKAKVSGVENVLDKYRN